MKGKKTGGRKKGTPNKTQAQIREAMQLILEDNLDNLLEDIRALKPADRVKYVLELSKFVVPQLKAVELSSPDGDRFNIITIDLGSGINPEEDEDN